MINKNRSERNEEKNLISQTQSYMQDEEKLAQYPQWPPPSAYDLHLSKEIPPEKLKELFVGHQDRFDEEYKQKLFKLGEAELTQEAKIKYDMTLGQAKVNYLALSKRS